MRLRLPEISVKGRSVHGILHRLSRHTDGRRGFRQCQLSTDAPEAPDTKLHRNRLAEILFWTGEVLGALSLFGILFILLFIGGILQ